MAAAQTAFSIPQYGYFHLDISILTSTVSGDEVEGDSPLDFYGTCVVQLRSGGDSGSPLALPNSQAAKPCNIPQTSRS